MSKRGTKIQANLDRVEEFTRGYITDNGFSPSVRDIQDGCSISSTSVTSYYLDKLQEDGILTRQKDISRSIVFENPALPPPELTSYIKGPRWRNLKKVVREAAVLSACEVVSMDEEKELFKKTLFYTVRGNMGLLSKFTNYLEQRVGHDDDWEQIEGITESWPSGKALALNTSESDKDA